MFDEVFKLNQRLTNENIDLTLQLDNSKDQFEQHLRICKNNHEPISKLKIETTAPEATIDEKNPNNESMASNVFFSQFSAKETKSFDCLKNWYKNNFIIMLTVPLMCFL